MDDRERALRYLAELGERSRRRTKLDPDALLFKPQRDFATDTRSKIAAVCSRRAGKSFGLAFKLLNAGFKHKRSTSLYIVQSRETAKEIVWPALRKMDDELQLGLKFRENNGDVVFPNGSKILMRGAGSLREVEKIRGGGSGHPLIVIDEAQVFPTSLLDYLISEVAEPATLDYGDEGQICLTGTPNAACAGYFYQATVKGEGNWGVHTWTLLDNPNLPNKEAWLEKKRKDNGWGLDHPKYLREYCGVWVRDSEGLVYRFNDNINTIPSFRPSMAPDWEYILGIDLGYNDPTAFVVLAYSEHMGEAHVVTSWKEAELTPSRVAAKVEALTQDFRFSRIVADTGGFGKGYVEEMKEKHGIPVLPAKKRDKAAFVSHLNSDLASGTLKVAVDENQELVDELRLLQWDTDKLEATGKLIEDSRFDNHLCDALLYAWRECYHHNDDWELEWPRYGTRAWQEAEEQRLEDASRRAYIDSEKESWWEHEFADADLFV